MANAMFCWARTWFSSTKSLSTMNTLSCRSSDSSRAGVGGGCHIQGRVVGRHCNQSFLADQGEVLGKDVLPGVVNGNCLCMHHCQGPWAWLRHHRQRGILDARSVVAPCEESRTCLGVLIQVPRVVALPPNTMGTNGLFFTLVFFRRQKLAALPPCQVFP
jgi:hypothetical protein